VIKKILLGLLALLVLGFAGSYLLYSSYRAERLESLVQNSEIAETASGPIEYHLAGNSDPVVLFLHGTPGGYDQTTSMEGYRVLTPSRPGYLRTPLDVGRTPAEQAHAYAALLDSLGFDKVVVMGASGGGPSSIAFAAAYPERTLALIAMEAVSQPFDLTEDQPPPPFFMESDFFLWATLSLLDSFMGAEGIVGLLVPDPAIQQMILADPIKTEAITGLIWSVWPISQRSAGQENDSRQFGMLNLPSSSVTVPTLIVHGTEDVNVPYRQSQQLTEQISQAILHTVEGGDHMMPFSHSEEVEMAVEQFMATLDLE
jgi:pimeloyl-ACP methyl ester carboxylesterase